MLVIKETRRLQHPSEDAWFEVRLPLSVGDLKRMNMEGGGIVMSLDLAAEVIKGWSYPDPLTRENIERLDLDTFLWLSQEIAAGSGVRDDAEKKDSASSSPPALALEMPVSQTNSDT